MCSRKPNRKPCLHAAHIIVGGRSKQTRGIYGLSGGAKGGGEGKCRKWGTEDAWEGATALKNVVREGWRG